MNYSDIVICKAFRQILASPSAEIEDRLGPQAPLAIASYLSKLPPQEQLNPAAMAKHIAELCQNSGNEALEEWFLDIYNSLDEDGIAKLVKKTGDPDDEADGPSITPRQLKNEGRDILEDLQKWTTEMEPKTKRATKDDNQPAS